MAQRQARLHLLGTTVDLDQRHKTYHILPCRMGERSPDTTLIWTLYLSLSPLCPTSKWKESEAVILRNKAEVTLMIILLFLFSTTMGWCSIAWNLPGTVTNAYGASDSGIWCRRITGVRSYCMIYQLGTNTKVSNNVVTFWEQGTDKEGWTDQLRNRAVQNCPPKGLNLSKFKCC